MLKSPREKLILKQGLIVLAVLAGVYIFFLSPFLKEGRSIIDEELERKTGELKRFIALTGSLPSKESFTKLEKGKQALEQRFSDMVDFADPEKPRISDKDTEAGLYFIEKLHDTMKKFETDIGTRGIKLPENLGFGDGLPKDNMVPVLLRQLEIIEFTVTVLLKSRSAEINALKPLRSIEYIEPMTKELFYTELPVQISIKSDTNTLTGLLLELKNASPVISVKELHVKSIEPETGDVEARLVLSAFMVVRK